MQPGAVLGEAWELYRTHWRHLITIALVVYLALSLISLLLIVLLGAVGAIASLFVTLAGVFWLQGALIAAVADVRDGRADLSIGDTLRRVSPRIGAIAGAGILAGIGIGIGFILLVVPGCVLLTWWSLIIPVLVLEQTRVFEAFGRSRELVRGHAWSVFGVIVLTVLILIAVGILLAIALSWLPDELGAYVGDVVANSLTAPFAALAWTLMYYGLAGEPAELEPANA